MYLPKLFEESRPEVLHEFIRQHPLATLITRSADALCADHVPVLVFPDEGGKTLLRCHVARANPVWRSLIGGADVLAVFQDAGCYITPSWYPSKRATAKVVPTWNYVAVHAAGLAHAIEDAAWLRTFLTRLTDTREAGRAAPWRLTDAPADYIAMQLRAIVGIEIEVSSLQGKWKVSQNRTAEDAAGVVSGLREETGEAARAMARLVEERQRSR